MYHTDSAGSASRREISEPQLRFSVIIANFNYARFVARAIESALALDWGNVEVIVIDDGSTDNSAKVIQQYSRRITSIFQKNAGQRSANNAGFAQANGEVIVFLDADDVLEPGFAKAVAQVWRPGLSKVQVLMRRVDSVERPLGSLVPPLRIAPSAQQIESWARRTTEYPTPPGSGNAYSREFLARFFPLGPEHDDFTDSTCLALAPLLGDVVTVLEPLVLYRQHDSNDSNLLGKPGRFGREVARAILRQRSAEDVCRKLGVALPEADRLRRSRHLLQLRVASLRMLPEAHPMEGDTRWSAFIDAFASLFRSDFNPIATRIAVSLWALTTLFAPRVLARQLVTLRFARGR